MTTEIVDGVVTFYYNFVQDHKLLRVCNWKNKIQQTKTNKQTKIGK